MANLEDHLRESAKRGQLNHLSIIAHADRAGTLTFRASYRNTKSDGARHGEDADPVAAIIKAMGVRG